MNDILNKISIKNIYTIAKNISNQRHDQKKHYKSHLKLSDNYELVVVLGELLFSLIIKKHMD